MSQHSDVCWALPIKELSPSFRELLSKELNPRSTGLNADGYSMDWLGLADLMNYDNETIRNIEINPRDPTAALLDAFEKRKESTVGKLWGYLKDLERNDIVENERFILKLKREATRYNERMETSLQNDTASSASDIPWSWEDVPAQVSPRPEDCLTVGELIDRSNALGEFKIQTIHAFVSYCKNDFKFVKETLKPTLENVGFCLYIEERDLAPGNNINTITAEMIAKRCQKVLLIMTREYLHSREFDFQHNIALSLSPRASKRFIIPVLLEPLTIPLVLRHLCPVDNTRDLVKEFFWQRLKGAMLQDPDPAITLAEMAKLRAVDKLINNSIEEECYSPLPAYPVSPNNKELDENSSLSVSKKSPTVKPRTSSSSPYNQQSIEAYQNQPPKQPYHQLTPHYQMEEPGLINCNLSRTVDPKIHNQHSQQYTCLDTEIEHVAARNTNGHHISMKEEIGFKNEVPGEYNIDGYSGCNEETAPLWSNSLTAFSSKSANLKNKEGIYYISEQGITVSNPNTTDSGLTSIAITSQPVTEKEFSIPDGAHILSKMITLEPHGIVFEKHLLVKFPIYQHRYRSDQDVCLMYSDGICGCDGKKRWVKISQHNTPALHKDEIFWFINQGFCYMFLQHFSHIFLLEVPQSSNTVPAQYGIFLLVSVFGKYLKNKLIITVGFHCHRCFANLLEPKEVTGICTLGMDMDEVPYQWNTSQKNEWTKLKTYEILGKRKQTEFFNVSEQNPTRKQTEAVNVNEHFLLKQFLEGSFGTLLGYKLHCVYSLQGPVTINIAMDNNNGWECFNLEQEISVAQLLPLCNIDAIYNNTVVFRAKSEVNVDMEVEIDVKVLQDNHKSNIFVIACLKDISDQTEAVTADVGVMTDFQEITCEKVQTSATDYKEISDTKAVSFKTIVDVNSLEIQIGMESNPTDQQSLDTSINESQAVGKADMSQLHFHSGEFNNTLDNSNADVYNAAQLHSDKLADLSLNVSQTQEDHEACQHSENQIMKRSMSAFDDFPKRFSQLSNMNPHILQQFKGYNIGTAGLNPFHAFPQNIGAAGMNQIYPFYQTNIQYINYNQHSNPLDAQFPEADCVFNRSVVSEQEKLCDIIHNDCEAQLTAIAKAVGDTNGTVDMKNVTALSLLQVWKIHVKEGKCTWREFYDMLAKLKCHSAALQLKVVCDKDIMVRGLNKLKRDISLDTELCGILLELDVINLAEYDEIILTKSPPDKIHFLVLELLVKKPGNYVRVKGFFQALHSMRCYCDYIKEFMLCPEDLDEITSQ